MYKNILVSVDNSPHSDYAENIGVALAKNYHAKLIGFHVYSGKFHRFRFKILEDFLPEKYQIEAVLDYQRRIHSVLIERGLEIISLEYMKQLIEKCKKDEVPFEEKLIDGKNSDKIIEELDNSDVIVIGAQGVGEIKNLSKIGSNTRRVLRTSKKDIFIAKKPCEFKTILVGIDGSDYSFQMYENVLNIAKVFNSKIKVVSSYDPTFHRNVFSLLANVLSSEAGKVFKFNDQQELHNMVIDKSLEQLYKNHLEKAKKIAEKKELVVETELLEGKPYHAIYKKALEDKPDVIAVGRFGLHRGKYDTIGSNAENIAELSDTNVLILSTKDTDDSIGKQSSTESTSVPVIDGEVSWNDDAKRRLENIPKFARPMAILAIERYAKEQGIKTITPDVMKKARDQVEL
jgi:nucleotide-binding universal stress UspA family protein